MGNDQNIASISSSAPSNPSKLLSTIFINNDNVHHFCCGFIGSAKGTFCLKSKSLCPILLKCGSHATSKFTPELNTYYICKSQDNFAAFCDISISQSTIKLSGKSLDMDTPRTISDWRAIIQAISNIDESKSTSELQNAIDSMVDHDISAFLKTPSKLAVIKNKVEETTEEEKKMKREYAELKSNLQAFNPSVTSMINNANSLDDLKSIMQSQNDDFIELFRHLGESLFSRNIFNDISTDLRTLSDSVSFIKQSLGTNDSAIFPSAWTGIHDIYAAIDGFDLEDLEASIESTSFDVEVLNEHKAKMIAYWEALGKNWLPRIESLSQEVTQLKSKINNSLKASQLGQNYQTLDSLLGTSTPSHPRSTQVRFADNLGGDSSLPSSASTMEILELKNMVASLSAKVVSLEQDLSEKVGSDGTSNHENSFSQGQLGQVGVQYRHLFFKDPKDLESWMKTHMTHPGHGLFVDLVSFCEFFGNDRYVERNVTLNEVYMSSKIGYSTIQDSIVASSFQNVLPAAYGRSHLQSKNNTDDEQYLLAQPELPSLPTFSKWDNRDGNNGRRFWIRSETRKTEQQLDGCIRSQLSGAAQVLAKDLLMDSYSMSEALYTFISTSYEDTMHSGKFDSTQAWKLTCSFVKRIFQEIAMERVVARDGIDVGNPWNTAAKFLFATLKAHEVMADFMKLSIKDHPSISSEMVKFVCYAQPSNDASEFLTRIAGVESLQRADQSNISKLESRLKKVETWKSDADKLLKKLKEASSS